MLTVKRPLILTNSGVSHTVLPLELDVEGGAAEEWFTNESKGCHQESGKQTLTKRPRCPLESPPIKIALKISKEGGLLKVSLLSLDKFIAADFLTGLKI